MVRALIIIAAGLFPFVFGAFVAWDVNVREWDVLGRALVGIYSPCLAITAYLLTSETA